MRGIIHRWTSRGFGFIRQPDNPEMEDIFIHITEIEGNPKESQLEGLSVQFEPGFFRGKPVARNVKIVTPKTGGTL